MNAKHLHWLQQANAAPYFAGKKLWFYPLKSKLCRQFGVEDGFDLQVIEFACWGSDNRGIPCNPGAGLPKCGRCGGTGIYDRKRVVLRRWNIEGVIFHEPAPEIFYSRITPSGIIRGYIRHEGVTDKAGNKAFERLLLRYDPKQWAQLWLNRWRSWANSRTCKLRWNIARVRRLFTIAHPESDIPF